jgi:hypothetical protein
VYPYVDSVDRGSVLAVVAVSCLVAAAGVAASWRPLKRLSADSQHAIPRRLGWALVIAWCFVAILVQVALRSMSPHSLGVIVESDAANSFYSVAVRTDARSILSGFENVRQTWALHAQSNLPGKLLFVRALTRISTQPEVVAWLIIGVSNLGGLLLYVFIRDVSGDRFLAGLSAILYLFTPSKLYFVPLLNVVTPAVVLICACLTIRWLNTRRIVYAVGVGIAVYCLALFEPTALISGVLFSALLIHRLVSQRFPSRVAVVHIGFAFLAFMASYAAMNRVFGFDLLRAFAAVARDATEFNVDSGRPYSLWIRQNLVDFVFGVGWCQTVLFAAALGDGVVRWRSNSHWRATDVPPIVLICLSLLAMVGVADAIGVNRGEVTRLWTFLACVAQIPAAYVCGQLCSARALGVVIIATVVQVAVGAATIAFVAPF